ncbi:hypothetical protein, partial [Corallococcus sp. 4LFB]|uniref:hypothetical protein n=1 Tax=Corallococcus sp. 4LFB TaxID=3383249 RepID=UPI003974BB13
MIPFCGSAEEPDAIATFHGDNGSGKSNALKALSLFFHALIRYLDSEEISTDKDVTLDWGRGREDDRFALTPRDRSVDMDGPTELEAWFTDTRLGSIVVRFTPAGKRLRLRAESNDVSLSSDTNRFLTWIETPFGPNSYPCAILDSHAAATRRAFGYESSDRWRCASTSWSGWGGI